MSAYETVLLRWAVDAIYQRILPRLDQLAATQEKIMATQQQFRDQLQAFFKTVETLLGNVQKAVDDALAAKEAGDEAAFDTLSQDVSTELAKIQPAAAPLATSMGVDAPVAPPTP